MTESTADRPSAPSWWLALSALTVCAPWPGWDPSTTQIALVIALLVALARPRGSDCIPWLGVTLALVGAVAPIATGIERDRAEADFEATCRKTLTTAESMVGDDRLMRLFTVTGEALDPVLPFEILHQEARKVDGRTLYLADDRGSLVAWGGAERSYPVGARAIGPRSWGIEWSAARAVLYLREPIIIEGRIVGSVTVADPAELRGHEAWGMVAPSGRRLVLGSKDPLALEVATDVAPGIVIKVGSDQIAAVDRRTLFGFGWLLVLAFGLVSQPRRAWAVVLVGAAVVVPASTSPTAVEVSVLLLGTGAAVGRLGREIPARWAQLLVVLTIATAAAVRLLGPLSGTWTWLPDHLLRPGLGGVWMVALAWAAVGWPGLGRGPLRLERRVLAAVCLAALAVVVELAWVPIQIVGESGTGSVGVVLPRGAIQADDVWPVDPVSCRLDDAAPVLAHEWGLDRWSIPSRLSLVGADGLERSSWGDLTPAEEKVRLVRSFQVAGADGLRLDLVVATEPWNMLGDWASGQPIEKAWSQPVWTAVLTRSGNVAASLHPEIRDLDPVAAGKAYHSRKVWTTIRVGEDRLPARVVREGDWLVAFVAHPPEPPVWVVRAALAVVWVFLGMLLARPPRLRREELATFGGRLRLLVAGGVVIPLVILTLFLQLRLGREETRLEEVLGRDTLEAARYTVEHLGEGVAIDDGLAAWLARGWGGEVVFFDHTAVAGVSRPDLMSVGRLAQLPAVEAYPAYLLGRSDTVVSRRPGWVTTSVAVVVEDRRYLLQLHRADPLRSGDAPDAVDWLLTGGFLAALLALIATSRIEERLGASLRDLVDLARRLVRGDPVGPVRRPKETDLAEVLDAVRSMNEEVRRRELSLRHQEELLRITLANLAPAVMVLEPGGEVSFANPSAESLLDEHGNVVHGRIQEVASQSSDPSGVAVTSQPYPGRDLTWRVGVAGVPLPDGRSGLVAVIDDVTEIVRLDRLQQLNQLARIVAHEVKNPLTPVRLWVQELTEARRRDEPDFDRLLEEACAEISVQVQRLQDTASSFSNLVALERWQPELVDIGEVVEAATRGLGVLARRGISIRTHIPPDGQVQVMADRPWLTRALANLVQNSLDVLGDGPGEVDLSVVEQESRVVLTIEDSGGGVRTDQLPDLFSPHFSTTASGSGLGLALVHQVVTRCQGSVEAENGDRGLRIRIELPAA